MSIPRTNRTDPPSTARLVRSAAGAPARPTSAGRRFLWITRCGALFSLFAAGMPSIAQYVHPTKQGNVMIAGKPRETLRPDTEAGVAKPEVLRWADWHHTDSYLAGRRLRGEVMTLAPGSTIAPGGVLLDEPHLPESWWADLGAALDDLAAHPVIMDNKLAPWATPSTASASTSGPPCPRTPSPACHGRPPMRSALGEPARAPSGSAPCRSCTAWCVMDTAQFGRVAATEELS